MVGKRSKSHPAESNTEHGAIPSMCNVTKSKPESRYSDIPLPTLHLTVLYSNFTISL